MKKIIIFLSILLSLVYLSSAIDIVLNSWQKLETSSWNDLSSVLNKVDVSWWSLSINWKLVVNWKICLDNWNCLGECEDWYIWDANTNSCITPATTPETAWETCYTIKQADNSAVDGIYWIDPNWWDKTDAFQVYCDMTDDWWGWTKVIAFLWSSRAHANAWDVTPENIASWWYWKISDDNINLIKSKWVWELRFECRGRPYYIHNCTLNSVSTRTAACKVFSKTYWWIQYTWLYSSAASGINIHEWWDWQALVTNSSNSGVTWCASSLWGPWLNSWSVWAK
jgi:hypothetical protein